MPRAAHAARRDQMGERKGLTFPRVSVIDSSREINARDNEARRGGGEKAHYRLLLSRPLQKARELFSFSFVAKYYDSFRAELGCSSSSSSSSYFASEDTPAAVAQSYVNVLSRLRLPERAAASHSL